MYGTGAIDGFDIFVAKYDSSGKALWANRMVERGWDRGSDVAVDPAGNCYVTGGFQTALLFGVFGGPSLTATGDSGDEDECDDDDDCDSDEVCDDGECVDEDDDKIVIELDVPSGLTF